MKFQRLRLLNVGPVFLVTFFLVASLLHGKDNHHPRSIQIESVQLDKHNEMMAIKMEAPAIEETYPKSNLKIILYWNTFHNQTDMSFGFGRQPFIDAGCKITHCIAIDDRNLFNQTDAVIFHAGDYDERDLPSYRYPKQIFIFLNQDPLADGSRLPCFSHPHFYNWTMTHRRDSDVYLGMPYGAIRRRDNAGLINQISPRHKCFPSANKNKLVVWLNSRCSTLSQREDYIKQLTEFIPVDVYGKCGTLECLPRSDPHCETRLLANYKFYLAAEASLCPDYIAEKFYHALMNNIVPIVYGGADYSQFAPVNSYINIVDFKSPKELAEYLLLLDKNEALYEKYFDWKKDYKVIRKPLDGWCDLCEKLNDSESERKSYQDLFKWWNEDVPCLSGSSYLATIQS